MLEINIDKLPLHSIARMNKDMDNLIKSGVLKIKRVLLTGVSGFFGSHLLRHLLMNTDWEMICVVSWKHKGTPERVENAWKDLDKNRVTIIRHDLEAPFTEQTKKRIGKIDYILNVASNSHVDRSIEEPRPFILGNIESVITMLELARELPIRLRVQVRLLMFLPGEWPW